MNIVLNGNNKEVKNNSTILELLTDIHKEPAAVVIELNGEIIKRDKWAEHKLKLEDKLEIINFVGGG